MFRVWLVVGIRGRGSGRDALARSNVHTTHPIPLHCTWRFLGLYAGRSRIWRGLPYHGNKERVERRRGLERGRRGTQEGPRGRGGTNTVNTV
eukprot:4632298-Prymnesium_polylepis.2